MDQHGLETGFIAGREPTILVVCGATCPRSSFPLSLSSGLIAMLDLYQVCH